MGLLGDYLPDLLPDDPNKNAATRQGLLAFAGAMMNNHGGLLSGFGNGLVAGGSQYNDSLTQQQQQQQQQALRDAQLKQINVDTQISQSKLDRPANLAKIAAGIPPVGSISSGAPGMVSPISALPQIGQQRAPVMPAPTPLGGANFNLGYGSDSPDSMPAMPQQIATSQAATNQQPSGADAYQAQILYAQALARNGYPDDAKDVMAMAKSMRPTLKETRPQTAGGKRVMVNYFDDGSYATVDGVEPDLEKLAFGSSGGTYDGRDPYTGAVVSSTKMTATPGELLSNAESRASRAQSERHWQQDQDDANEPGKANETLAKQIAFYRQAPLGQFNLNKPWGTATMDRVLQLNPQYDAAQYGPRSAAIRSYAAGGKDSANIESINTGMNHLDTLRSLALAQKNGDTRLFNRLANQFANATGAAPPTNLNMAVQMIGPEVVKAVSGAAGTGEDRAHMAEALTGNGSYSADQILGAIGTTQELFAGRLREKKRSYERSTQLHDFEDNYLSPSAKALLQEKPAESANTIRPVSALPKLPPAAGVVQKGFRFKGGNPSDQANWEKVQ